MDNTSSGHFIRAKYLHANSRANARYVLTWEGWPTDGKTQRRTVEWAEGRELAANAAQLFCAWMSAGYPGEDEPPAFTPAHVAFASMGPDEWAIIVRTKDAREA